MSDNENFNRIISGLNEVARHAAGEAVPGMRVYVAGVERRDPARISRILDLVEKTWRRHPDMRLCQLIGNVTPDGDNYHFEDDALETALRSLYERT